MDDSCVSEASRIKEAETLAILREAEEDEEFVLGLSSKSKFDRTLNGTQNSVILSGCKAVIESGVNERTEGNKTWVVRKKNRFASTSEVAESSLIAPVSSLPLPAVIHSLHLPSSTIHSAQLNAMASELKSYGATSNAGWARRSVQSELAVARPTSLSGLISFLASLLLGVFGFASDLIRLPNHSTRCPRSVESFLLLSAQHFFKNLTVVGFVALNPVRAMTETLLQLPSLLERWSRANNSLRASSALAFAALKASMVHRKVCTALAWNEAATRIADSPAQLFDVALRQSSVDQFLIILKSSSVSSLPPELKLIPSLSISTAGAFEASSIACPSSSILSIAAASAAKVSSISVRSDLHQRRHPRSLEALARRKAKKATKRKIQRSNDFFMVYDDN